MLIQVLLIVVVVLVVARLFRSRGARAQAIRRIGLVVFAGVRGRLHPVPRRVEQLAGLVGVGRGTDLVLYALVVAFLSFTVTTYLRFRDLETNYTRLARRIALSEAAPAPASNRTPRTDPGAPAANSVAPGRASSVRRRRAPDASPGSS